MILNMGAGMHIVSNFEFQALLNHALETLETALETLAVSS